MTYNNRLSKATKRALVRTMLANDWGIHQASIQLNVNMDDLIQWRKLYEKGKL